MFFIEYVDLRAWFKYILPVIIRSAAPKRAKKVCYLYDCNFFTLAVIFFTGLFFGIKVKVLVFSISDIRDENGVSVRLNTLYDGLAIAADGMEESPAFQKLFHSDSGCPRLRNFLAKSLVIPYHFSGGRKYTQVYHALIITRISAATRHSESTFVSLSAGSGRRISTVFLNERPFKDVLSRYAEKYGLSLYFCPLYKSKFDFAGFINKAKTIKSGSYFPILRNKVNLKLGRLNAPEIKNNGSVQAESAKMAAAYYGHFNFDKPECFSDLFFLHNNRRLAEKTVLTFSLPQDPLDEAKLKSLREHGISPLVFSDYAATVDYSQTRVSRYIRGKPRLARMPYSLPEISGLEPEKLFFKKQIADYAATKNYWADVCAKNGIKLYLGWYNCDLGHIAQADALSSIGGAAAIYQRSYEQLPCAETRVAVDILFGFSSRGAEIEKASKSEIPYFVVTGYLGDFRFPLLKDKAAQVRAELKKNGAEKIIAFLDENTFSDSRWFTGDEFTRANYQFLFEKLLENPWLGLVCKPKTPQTLRRRLGPVARLMAKALATKRCFIFADGVIQGAYPPAAAALASDLAVHEVLSAGTAGIESALAGVRTLLMDKEGWAKSPLYKLGKGKVVFDDWDTMWKACQEHFQSRGGIPGFGDWNEMIEEFDPFRDGRATERMGTYLRFLLDRFDAKVAPEVALADAAQEYTHVWGKEKVIKVG